MQRIPEASIRTLTAIAAANALVMVLSVPAWTDAPVAAHDDAGSGAVERSAEADGHGSGGAAAPAVEVLGRWIGYLGLFAAVSVPLLHRLTLRSGGVPRRLTRTLGAGLVASGLAAAAMLALGDADQGAASWNLLAARAALGVIGGLVVLAASPRLAATLAVAVGFGGIVLLVAGGHATPAGGLTTFAAQLIHVLGAAVWIGGVALLAALIRWPAFVLDGIPPPLRLVVPRLSAVALLSVGLVVLTGVQTAMAQAATIELRSEYGHTLLMKGGFATGALVLGALNFLDGGRMRRWIDDIGNRATVELMLMATVLVMSAALAGTPTQPVGGATPPVAAGASPVAALVVAASGILAAVAGLLGMRLPRCEARASRVALVAAGIATLALAGSMLASRVAA